MATALYRREVDIFSQFDLGREVSLLKACLAQEDQFEVAFGEFDSDENLDALTWGEIRLIPFLFRKLEHSGISTPRFSIYKGIYTKFWYVHKMEREPTALLLFSALGEFDLLFLKGAALQKLVYIGDPVTRPVDDIDILVRPKDRILVIEKLLQEGFEPDQVWPREITMNLKMSIGLSNQSHHVDVHWGLYPSAGKSHPVEQLYERRIRTSTGIHDLPTLSISDHLLHNLIHGHAKNQVSPIRWVLDCALLATHPKNDWSLLTATATDWGWQRAAKAQLNVLRSGYQVDIPNHVFGGLETGNSSVPLGWYQVNRGLRPSVRRGLMSMLVANPLNLREISGNRSRPYLAHLFQALAIWWKAWEGPISRWNRFWVLVGSTRQKASPSTFRN